jgi:hypothetical protein
MAYTIRFHEVRSELTIAAAVALANRLVSDGRFSAALEDGPKRGDIVLRKIRLREAKLYCGQHAGPCDLPRPFERPKKKLRILEWFDFIEFNGLVNDVLDELHCAADVWSTPPDLRLDRGRKLWVRRGEKRRHRWDVEARPIRNGEQWLDYVANHGSEEQFQSKEAEHAESN